MTVSGFRKEWMNVTVAQNGTAVARSDLGSLTAVDFEQFCMEKRTAGQRLSALLALPWKDDGKTQILAVVADDAKRRLSLPFTSIGPGEEYGSLARNWPAAEAFERALWEETGIIPAGHPWLKPLRRFREGFQESTQQRSVDPYPFFSLAGDAIHEVAVGPIHAGIIEPGHFRFQCHGEEVFHLEIRLGYQHRGGIDLLLRSSPERRLAIAESIAGDTVIGHAWAYCRCCEALSGVVAPPRAEAIRAVALELERLANHVGDLGALCNDVGFLPGSAYFGRLRGEFLNGLMEISGNRFGRGLLVPGGVRADLADAQRIDLRKKILAIGREVKEVSQMIFDANTVAARFEKTGTLANDVAQEIGLVGPAARASGCDRDVRRDHPYGPYGSLPLPVAQRREGDVMARAVVRRLEIEHSLQFLLTQLEQWPPGLFAASGAPLKADLLTISLVEGWRGEIMHCAATDGEGRLQGYSAVDPSLHNWLGLALAMRGNQISDFPLCNKSFNLSYAGHDL